jgi:hypothetical protein
LVSNIQAFVSRQVVQDKIVTRIVALGWTGLRRLEWYIAVGIQTLSAHWDRKKCQVCGRNKLLGRVTGAKSMPETRLEVEHEELNQMQSRECTEKCVRRMTWCQKKEDEPSTSSTLVDGGYRASERRRSA